MSCVFAFSMGAMVTDKDQQRQEHVIKWLQFKLQVEKFSYDTLKLGDLFYLQGNNICVHIDHCLSYRFLDDEKLAIEMQETLFKTQKYSFCLLWCEHTHKAKNSYAYVFNTLHKILTQASPNHIPKDEQIVTQEKINIVNCCKKYGQALGIGDESPRYAISQLCTHAAHVSGQGVIYIIKPGNELTMRISPTRGQDVRFEFW
jgi:hypothetical protein